MCLADAKVFRAQSGSLQMQHVTMGLPQFPKEKHCGCGSALHPQGTSASSQALG